MFQLTTATKRVANMKARIRIVQGGTSASKTISILLNLINLCQSDTKPTLTSVVAESFPHLRRGAMRDFLNIMEAHGYFKDSLWNKSEFTYTFETGSRLEFFSADMPSKVRGPRRDRLFMNEANNMPLESFEQLEVRTREFVFLDFNPTNEFWVFTEIIPNRTDFEHVILTYLDNEGLSKEIVSSIEQRKNRASWWRVYGMGLLGEVDGKIYKGWHIIDEVPHEARLIGRGMDFGYSNDPSTITDVYEYNGGYILDEILYRKGMSNKQLADILNAQEHDVYTVADSAEPKSIDEIKSYGVNILPCKKGQGSIAQGIQFVQDQKISMTKRSANIIKEYRNYLWDTDRDGNILNKPEGGYDHAMDGIRYFISSQVSHKKTFTDEEFDHLFGSSYSLHDDIGL
jgi:phage terminase large subunit